MIPLPRVDPPLAIPMKGQYFLHPENTVIRKYVKIILLPTDVNFSLSKFISLYLIRDNFHKKL